MTDQAQLKNIGLKATYPRLKILDIFRKGDVRHMSAEDVYRALMNDGVEIGLATVYRVLTQFEQAGLLERSQFDTGKAVFELNEGDHHDHLVCTSCGLVEEFYDAEIERRQYNVAKEHDFTLTGHTMALYGLCPTCTAARQKPAP